MRTLLIGSILIAIPFAGCSSSTEPEPVGEVMAANDYDPNDPYEVRIPAPDPRVLPVPPMAHELVRPELGPFVDATNAPPGLGRPCATSAQCLSGHCSDGVCCDVSCTSPCEACDMKGAKGFCLPHPEGTDPEAGCGQSACFAGVAEAFSCDGAGTCQVHLTSCGDYACGESKCLDACRDDIECSGRARCVEGKCVAQ